MNLEIKFNEINLSTIAIIIFIVNDILISLVLYIWYSLYNSKIITSPHPFFAYAVSLLYNVIVYIYILRGNISFIKLLIYTLFLLFLKIMPIASMIINNDIVIDYSSVYITIYIIIIYSLIIIIFNSILLKNNINIIDILSKNNVMYTADSIDNVVTIKMS